MSISDKKCIPLLPGVATFNATFARDGKSFLYAVASRGEVTIYRQHWNNGKLVGAPQVGLKVPFVFGLGYQQGNAYDFLGTFLPSSMLAPAATPTSIF